MGLNKETRDFFVNKINAVLDKKLAKASEGIVFDRVREVAKKRMCQKLGIDPKMIARFLEIQKEEEKLKEEREEITRKVDKALSHVKRPDEHYYGSSVYQLDSYAIKNFKDEAIEELYPDLVPLIRKIEKIKEDVYGSVLIATTEPKLVATLTKLLQNYGGDISELLELIPQQ